MLCDLNENDLCSVRTIEQIMAINSIKLVNRNSKLYVVNRAFPTDSTLLLINSQLMN
jgi:hypothetical protein